MSNTKITGQIALYERLSKDDEMQGESKTLAISKWKLEVNTLKKKKNILYNQILDIREEVEQSEEVKNFIEQLQKRKKRLSQVDRNELKLEL